MSMAPEPSIAHHAAGASTPPATVWLLTVLLAAMAFVSVVGALLFAFPLGGALGAGAGSLLLAAGTGYAATARGLRRGGRAVWTAALVVPVVHTLGLNTLDLVTHGVIPSEDYPFMGIAFAIVLLLLLPSTRRFCAPATG
jgi:hypothetical protein